MSYICQRKPEDDIGAKKSDREILLETEKSLSQLHESTAWYLTQCSKPPKRKCASRDMTTDQTAYRNKSWSQDLPRFYDAAQSSKPTSHLNDSDLPNENMQAVTWHQTRQLMNTWWKVEVFSPNTRHALASKLHRLAVTLASSVAIL